MTGFEDTGLWPINRQMVLRQIQEKRPTRMQPALPSLLPKEQRFAEAIRTTDHIATKYLDQFSSPTRERFQHVASTTREAVLLYDHIQDQKQADREREERLSKKMRRRVYKIPTDGDKQSLSKAELAQLAAQRHAKEQQIERAKQLKVLKSHRKTIKQLQEIWRGEAKGKVTWRRWLEQYKEDHKEEFIPLESKHPLAVEDLTDDQLFIMDTHGVTSSDVDQLRRPLRDYSPFDSDASDASVQFMLGDDTTADAAGSNAEEAVESDVEEVVGSDAELEEAVGTDVEAEEQST